MPVYTEYSETDVNARDNNGWTTHHWACSKQPPELAGFRLSVSGRDSSLGDVNGLTAFDIPCETEGKNETAPHNETIPAMFTDGENGSR